MSAKINENKVYDRGALSGFRGLAAFHLLVFHSFFFSSYPLDILHAAVHLPLFFLLSGFCLTLSYTNRTGSDASFDTWNFYKNRFSRILPVYYLCMLFAIPSSFIRDSEYDPTGNWKHLLGLIEAVFGLSTLIMVHGFGPNGPEWTICTLSIFYWIFPKFLTTAQKWTTKSLSNAVVLLFYLQLILGLVLSTTLCLLLDYQTGYWIAIAHPFSRLPVFCMGVCAGLLVQRKVDQDELDRKCATTTLLHDAIPWISIAPPSPTPKSNKKSSPDPDPDPANPSERSWSNRVDIDVVAYFLLLTIFSVLHFLYNHCLDYWKNQDGSDPDPLPHEVFIFKNRLFHMWLQFGMVHLQLMIVIGLCFDGGLSNFSRLCRSRLMQFLGRISLSLYLVHEPAIFYISWIIQGPFASDIDDSFKYQPVWAVPIHLVVSIILATFLTIFVEEPCKKVLRQRLK